MIQTTFQCFCESQKKHRLILDGSVLGHYILELCASCYVTQDKKFLLSEEIINEKSVE